MYDSLQLPWSQDPTPAEIQYRNAGGVNTKGTIYLLPPSAEVLEAAYRAPPRARSEMSSGAIALCKHFERGIGSSEHGRPHPFWTLPVGSSQKKDEIAIMHLEAMMKSIDWKNVMLLHRGVAVYEIRNRLGYGFRWTLCVEEVKNETFPRHIDIVDVEEASDTSNDKKKAYSITKTTFRGFIEPVIGLDHELK